MSDILPRAALAVLLAAALAYVLNRATRIPRDLALAIFAVTVAVLGIFAIFGPTAAAIGGAAIVGAFIVGAMVYGLIALVGRLAR